MKHKFVYRDAVQRLCQCGRRYGPVYAWKWQNFCNMIPLATYLQPGASQQTMYGCTRFKTRNEGFHLTVQLYAILSLSVREQRFGSSVLFNKHVGFHEHIYVSAKQHSLL